MRVCVHCTCVCVCVNVETKAVCVRCLSLPLQSVIYGNLTASMRVVIAAMDKLAIPYANSTSQVTDSTIPPLRGCVSQLWICAQEHARVILGLSTSLSSYDAFPPEVTAAFVGLWSDAGVQECFSRAYEYQLNDSAP